MKAERYREIASSNRMMMYAIDPLHAMIIHGSIKLMLQHPEVEKTFSQSFKKASQNILEDLESFFQELGMTEEDYQGWV